MKPIIWDPSWKPFFKAHAEELDRIFEQIKTIGKKRDGISFPAYFPDEEHIFRFTAIPSDRVKGVIVGMEPYASYTLNRVMEYGKVVNKVIPEATGRSFEVASVDSWQQKFKQSSLQNILKAFCLELSGKEMTLDQIRDCIKDGTIVLPKPHEWFGLMEGKEIMFLNTALTVAPGETGSHLKYWKSFTEQLVRYIAQNSPDACWMLFGKDAQNTLGPILDDCGCENVVKTCHPRLPGFVKERPFRGIKYGH